MKMELKAMPWKQILGVVCLLVEIGAFAYLFIRIERLSTSVAALAPSKGSHAQQPPQVMDMPTGPVTSPLPTVQAPAVTSTLPFTHGPGSQVHQLDTDAWKKIPFNDDKTGIYGSFMVPKPASTMQEMQQGSPFGKQQDELVHYKLVPAAGRIGELGVAVLPMTKEVTDLYTCQTANGDSYEKIGDQLYCVRVSQDCGAGSCGNGYEYFMILQGKTPDQGHVVTFRLATQGSTCQAYEDPKDCPLFYDVIFRKVANSFLVKGQ